MDTNSNKRFCAKPFSEFSVLFNGQAQCCCPTWLKEPLGNLNSQSLDEIWNGKQMQKVRQGIIDGSYSMCKADACPFLASGGPDKPRNNGQKGIAGADYDAGKTVLEHGPLSLNMCHDQHCNLACPSCRVGFITGTKPGTVVLHKKIMAEGVRDALMLIMSGDGDPFASKLYREILQNLDRKDFPNLEKILLLTNGTLWNKKMWDSISASHEYIEKANISVDGATKETYELNRKGGKWPVLLRNLDFISTLGLSVTICVVIQNNNFREIPQFIELAHSRGFCVIFYKLIDCGTYPPGGFERRAVWMKGHKNHEKLKMTITENRGENINYGNLLSMFK